MPQTDQILARTNALPIAFACTATHGGLDAAWVNVVGELDIATTPELEQTLRESQRLAHLTVLDLRELTFIDCAGVHTIVNASLRARKDGRRLVLVRGRPDIYRIFTLTGSSDDVDIADPRPGPVASPSAPALARLAESAQDRRDGSPSRALSLTTKRPAPTRAAFRPAAMTL